VVWPNNFSELSCGRAGLVLIYAVVYQLSRTAKLKLTVWLCGQNT